jgi:hypothetical protein
MQQVGVKFCIRNIVTWKMYNIKPANAHQAQVTFNFKNTKEKLLKSP